MQLNEEWDAERNALANPSKEAIVQKISNIDVVLAPIDIEIPKDDAFKIPLDQLPAMGAIFSSLNEKSATASATFDIPKALVALDSKGNQLDASILFSFKDGSGHLGSYKDVAGNLHQARLVESAGGTVQSAIVIPPDPTLMAMAAALAVINTKLDAIEKTQQEMFEYLRDKDRAELRGDLNVLSSTLHDYRFNWDNETWMTNSHKSVQDIRRNCEQQIVHLRAQIQKELSKEDLIKSRLSVGGKLEAICDRMKEYQLASYACAFALFLEPILSENFNKEYLSSVAEKIEAKSLEYRRLYTKCYNAIEADAKESIDTAVLDGVSFAGRLIGNIVAVTPIGDNTQIDEILIDAGKSVSKFNNKQTTSLMSKLREAKSPGMLPFKKSVNKLNQLYNSPMKLFVDSSTVYLVPEKE